MLKIKKNILALFFSGYLLFGFKQLVFASCTPGVTSCYDAGDGWSYTIGQDGDAVREPSNPSSAIYQPSQYYGKDGQWHNVCGGGTCTGEEPGSIGCIPKNCANETYCGPNFPAGCSFTCYCKECELCAARCGQAKQCGGYCSTEDTGAMDKEGTTAPIGTDGTPAVIVNDQTPHLSWEQNTNDQTDRYEVKVTDIGGTRFDVFADGLGTTGIGTTTLSFNTMYHWNVRAQNTLCNPYGVDGFGPWSDDQYFYLAQAPFIKSFELDNIAGVLNPDPQGRNHICQQSFYDTTTGADTRRLMVKLTMTEAHLVAPISAVYLRFNDNNGHIYLQVNVDNLDTTPISSITGLEANNVHFYQDVGTSQSVAMGTDTPMDSVSVFLPLEFDNSFNPDTYSLEARGVDVNNVEVWFDTNRDFKVWNCRVPIIGTIFDGSAAQSYATEAGFSNPVGDGFKFTSLDYTNGAFAGSNLSDATQSMLVIKPADYNDNSTGRLVWGKNYTAVFNRDVAGVAPVMRILDRGDQGDPTPKGGATTSVSLDDDYVNPYSTSPRARVDFSFIIDQDPWFQVAGAGVMAQNVLQTNVPATCALNEGCIPATSIDGTNADGGLLSGKTITTNSGCPVDPALGGGLLCRSGQTNNWSIEASLLSGDDRNTYSEVMNRYFGINGVGVTLGTGTSMSTILAEGIGGTGVIFVNSDLTVDVDNTVPVGNFLMMVVKGRITFSSTVSQSAGIFMADNGIVADGTSDKQLVIEGVLFSSGRAQDGDIRLSRGFETKRQNNTEPATVVNYRPDLMFNMPGKVVQVLSGWNTPM